MSISWSKDLEEFCVKSMLHVTKSEVREMIEEIVQIRSRVESQGNTVFTLSILRQFEATGSLHAKMCSQSFIGACRV